MKKPERDELLNSIAVEIEHQFVGFRKEVVDRLTSAHVRILGDLQRIALRPDDLLILETDFVLTVDQVAQLRSRMAATLRDAFPGRYSADDSKVPVVILTSGLKLAAVLSTPQEGQDDGSR